MRYDYKVSFTENGEHNKLPGWVIAALAILVLLFLTGIPKSDLDEPPPGVHRYRKDNLTCWDKVVCCNPSDESTCVRIPICEMDR